MTYLSCRITLAAALFACAFIANATPISVTPGAIRSPLGIAPGSFGVSAAAGPTATCSINPSGGVQCSGRNVDGQLGDGTRLGRASAVQVLGLESGVVQIAMGTAHACAVTAAGGVKCWGSNTYGQLGDGTTKDRLVPFDVPGITGAAGVAAGIAHTCALLANGGVKCWGTDIFNVGVMGDGKARYILPRPVAIGPTVVSGVDGAVSLVSGSESNCVLTRAGGVECWGGNGMGQLGDGTDVDSSRLVQTQSLATGVKSISAGSLHVCAVLSDGGVKCWGGNNAGQLGDGTTKASYTPISVDIFNVTSVSAGDLHTCAVASGNVKCWGSNSQGQLGDGTNTDRSHPVAALNLANAHSVSVGAVHSCAVTIMGDVRCWGGNEYGQLGDGTRTARSLPGVASGRCVGACSPKAPEAGDPDFTDSKSR